jgi:hypothetical protein
MVHNDYDRKGSVAKKETSGRDPQEAWRQDELFNRQIKVILNLTLSV